MNLILAIVDFVLVGLYISLSMKNEGKSKKLYAICAVLWAITGIINLGLFIT